MKRCFWVPENCQIYQDYHDFEWGKALFNAEKLFEILCLETQQSGLSWLTVLKKRAAYQREFQQFKPIKIAEFDTEKLENLLQNKELIRNRKKLSAIITNARAFVKMQENGEDFADFVWGFVNHQPIINHLQAGEIITTIPEAKSLTKALKARGFVFIGDTTCYSFMQAAGLVNNHQVDCHFK